MTAAFSHDEVLNLVSTNRAYQLCAQLGDSEFKACFSEPFQPNRFHLLLLSQLEMMFEPIFCWSFNEASLALIRPKLDCEAHKELLDYFLVPDPKFIDFVELIARVKTATQNCCDFREDEVEMLLRPRNLDSRVFRALSIIVGLDFVREAHLHYEKFLDMSFSFQWYPSIMIGDATANSECVFSLLHYVKHKFQSCEPRLINLLPPIQCENNGHIYNFKDLYFKRAISSFCSLNFDDPEIQTHTTLVDDWGSDCSVIESREFKQMCSLDQTDVSFLLSPEKKILELISCQPYSAKTLAVMLKRPKGQVNRSLYMLREQGLVVRSATTPPLWTASNSYLFSRMVPKKE